ncbi:MAG: hypothetical protein LBG77_01240 [Dysgonamonadaceae bacterium]|jgi:hypothetical protein|nr:hypothetical protein [Dysgonamonadaceae bacterium]
MKRVSVLLFLAFALFIRCSEDKIDREEPKSTILTVKTTFKDNEVHPYGQVYIYDASENQLKDVYYPLDGITIGKISDVDGKIVRPIATERLHDNTNPNGSTDDYSYAMFNLDKVIYYSEKTKGNIFIVIVLSNTEKYTYKTIQWEKKQTIEISKQFDGEYPKLSFEEWH